MKQNIPFSKEKECWRATKLYWKAYIRKLEGKVVNKNIIKKRKEIAGIEITEDVMIEEAKDRYENAC